MGRKVYVKSFGCSTNLADGEVIAGCLKHAGYEITQNPSEAEILIYNTCAVKSPTEDKMVNILKKIPENKKLVVTGCLPLINLERLQKEVRFNGVIGPSPGSEIVNIVRRVENGEKPLVLRNDLKPSLSLPRVTVSPVSRIIPIAYGCLGACSFCCVRFARGKLRSQPMDEILEQVKKAVKGGVKEIWLTAQDLAVYGKDLGLTLPVLLNKVLEEVKGDFFVRLGMMNPHNVLEILDELIEVYKNDKIFKFLHLPVQSGDDEVLGLMNRFYTVKDFKRIVFSIRKKIPRLTLATDMICGFPGETEEAFRRSLRLIEEVKPDIVNISKFYPRPRTPAERMKQLPSWEVKNRSRRMTETALKVSLERNLSWVSWEGEI
ncbi:MiaB/RimO family radical SAM methylthiotransferase, partial [Candidatus Bathyarchaeota archaeon]